MSIDIGELLDVEDAAEPRTVIQQNMEVLARRIWKREGTYQNGSETTLIGPPTSGERVLKEHWIDSLGGEFVCTVAGTPGTWKQTRPAVVNGEPGSGTIPTGYLIHDADDNHKLKIHLGSFAWGDLSAFQVASNPKATTAAVEYLAGIRSNDASTPLQLRFGVRTHSTDSSRYTVLDSEDAGVGRFLVINPSGGAVGIGTSNIQGKLHVEGTVIVPNATSYNSFDTGGTVRAIARIDGANGTAITSGGAYVEFEDSSFNTLFRVTESGDAGLGIAGATANSRWHVRTSNAATSAVYNLTTWDANSTGTPSAGFGQRHLFRLESSTTDNTNAAAMDVLWATATHASVTSRMTFSLRNAGAALAEAFGFNADGSLRLTAAVTTDTAPADSTARKKLSLQRRSAAPTNAAYIKFTQSPGTPTNDFYLVLESAA